MGGRRGEDAGRNERRRRRHTHEEGAWGGRVGWAGGRTVCETFSFCSTTYSFVSQSTPPLSSVSHTTRLRLLSVDGLAETEAARSTRDGCVPPPPPTGGTMTVGWVQGALPHAQAAGVGGSRAAELGVKGCMGRRGFVWSGFSEALRGTAALSAESSELSSSSEAAGCLGRLLSASRPSGRARLAGAESAFDAAPPPTSADVSAFHRSSRPFVSAITAMSSLFSADLRSLLTTLPTPESVSDLMVIGMWSRSASHDIVRSCCWD